MLAMCVSVLASCSDGGSEEPANPTPKPEVVTPEITINADVLTNGLSFGTEAGETTLTFSTNVDWTLSIASTAGGTAWCKASVSSGSKGSSTVKFTVTEHTDYDDRSVSVTVKAGTASKTFTITQKCVEALLLTTDKYEVAQDGGTIEVEVKANIDYEVTISETAKSWITASESKSRALTTRKHTFTIASSEEAEKREGEIIFKSGDKVETVKVYQAGGAIILLTKDEYTVSDAGETITVDIKSNVEYGVQMPDVDWITDEASSRGMSSHTLKYVIAPNEGYDSRSAEIIFYDKNSDLKDTLKVVQAQKDAIVISQKEYDIEAEGGTIEVKLSANVDFEVLMPKADWISQTESRALKEHSLYFKVTENTSDDSRLTNIVFMNKDTQLSDTITIEQAGKIKLALSNREFNVSDKGDTISVNVKSSIEYGIKMPEVDWIKQDTNTRTTSTETLKFIIIPNEKDYSRSAEIIFYDKNSVFKDTIKVIQKQKDEISIIPEYKVAIKGGTIKLAAWANVDFDVYIPSDVTWITQALSRGTTARYFYLDVDENTGESSRSASIIVSNIDKQLADTLVIFQSGTSVAVTTYKTGTLIDQIDEGRWVDDEDDVKYIKSLKITGPINSTDVKTLRQMLGASEYDESSRGKLTTLDLSEASIFLSGHTPAYVINNSTFFKCTNLQCITLPKNTTRIDPQTFQECESLASISIPDSVTSIGKRAFWGCSSLSSATIGNGVTVIAECAFQNCQSLTSVIMGSGVTYIGLYAFYACPYLKDFYCYATTPPQLETDIDFTVVPTEIIGPFGKSGIERTLYVPANSLEKYKESDWSIFFNNIKEMD